MHRPSAPKPGARAKKSAARREAILAAALDEFSRQGFSATRLDDVAARAGVAKGTIYLHFKDKEALFQELVRTLMTPPVDALAALGQSEAPTRALMRAFAELFAREVQGTPRRDIIRLIVAEGPRFPQLASFYYETVVSRGLATLRALLQRARERGELKHSALAEFPQLVVAPALMAVIWSGLFERFAPLDARKLLEAHLDILFGSEGEQ